MGLGSAGLVAWVREWPFTDCCHPLSAAERLPSVPGTDAEGEAGGVFKAHMYWEPTLLYLFPLRMARAPALTI